MGLPIIRRATATVLFLAGLIFAGDQGLSQTSMSCVGARQQSLHDAESSLASLRRLLHEKRQEPASSFGNNQANKKIEELENAVADATFDLGCFRENWEPPPKLRGDGQTISLTLHYSTNRVPAAQRTASGKPAFGDDVSDTLYSGRVVVSVPNHHTLGNLELPALWRFERGDPSKHFTVTDIVGLNAKDAAIEIKAALDQARAKTIFVFVHGFRVSFEEAALRTAQLAVDLRFPGVAMFFSWPAKGATKGYLHDGEAAELSVRQFDAFLTSLAHLPTNDIYVLAHSMGSRIAAKALAQQVDERRHSDKVRDLLLAAPDINAEIFKREIAPSLARMGRTGRTIYASSDDVALRASRNANEFPRVGETVDGVKIFQGFNTIDASTAAPVWRSFGHSYVFDSAKVIGDVEDSLVWRRVFSERSLDRAGAAPNEYWRLR